MKTDVLFDMETSDPDDVFTLCLLAAHPAVVLRAVTVTPGSPEQVGVVRRVLDRVGRSDVPVGSRNPQPKPGAVSGFHHSFLGDPPSAEPDAVAHELLAAKLAEFPAAVLLTGAPLHNLRLLLTHHPSARLVRWVGQGGFAGDGVVPAEHRLAKFAGRETCESFNFGGDPKGALLALASPAIARRDLVSKNVCHGVCYDEAFHARLAPFKDTTAGLALLYEGMAHYLRKQPGGKLFHDPLAACVLIDPGVVVLAEVEVYRSEGRWGSRRAAGTNTFISVAVDRDRFFRTLVAQPAPPAAPP